MKLIVIAVGNKMPDWVSTAWKDYVKRMPADCTIELREIKPEPRTSGKTAAQMMEAEGRRIQAALPADSLVIALDEHGRDLTTMDLSQQLAGWRDHSQDVAFLIGGPDGLDADLKKRSASLIRLSSLTLPHPMVRIVLAEQLYRAWAILTNHPYHRA